MTPAKEAPTAKAVSFIFTRGMPMGDGRGLIFADRRPGPADLRVVQAAGDEDDDDNDHQGEQVKHQIIHIRRTDRMADHAAEDGIEPVDRELRHGRPLDRGDALRAVGEIEGFVEVVGEHPDNLAEAEGDDGQVIAPQPQDRQAEQNAGQRRDDDPDQKET